VDSMIPQVPTMLPAPGVTDPIPGHVLAVRDDVRVGGGDVWSDEVLQAGVDYRVTVSGTRKIARGVYTDGQCLAIDGRWESRGSLDLYHPDLTHGALYIGGVRFLGNAPAADSTGCALHSHTMTYRPTTTGRVDLRLWDPTGSGDNDGAVSVRFDRVTSVPLPSSAPAETVRTGGDWGLAKETITVPADEAAGRISALRLRAGKSATVYVEGTVQVDADRSVDASCVEDGWNWVTSLGLPSGQDLFELSVDGQDVDWLTSRTRQSGCDSRHQYSLHYTAQKSGPLRLALVDLDYGDNSGSYTVTIVRD